MAFEKLSPRHEDGPGSLERLAACMEASKTGSLIDIWGSVSELTASHVRIAGLSKFTKLGDWIAIETDPAARLRKPFASTAIRSSSGRSMSSTGLRSAPGRK